MTRPRPGQGAYAHLDLTADEINTFGSMPTIGFVHEFPLTLFRAVGASFAKDGSERVVMGSPRGRFWFDSSLFWKLRRAVAAKGTSLAARETILRWLLRDSLAVSRDWSSIRSIYCLHLTHGPLVAAWGPAAPQKTLSSRSAKAVLDEAHLTDALAGGGLQYVIDIEAQGLASKVTRYDSLSSLSISGEA